MFDLAQIKGAGFDEVLRQMSAAVIIVEAPSGKVVFSNDRAREVMERNLDRSVPQELEDFRDFRDKGVFEAFHPDGRAYDPEEWPLTRSIRTGEEVRNEEMVHHPPDGTRITVRCDASPIRDDEGRIVVGVAVYSDITQQKRSDQELAYYARLRDNTQDAFIATDEHYVVTVWNKGAEEIYGWTAEEVLGRDVREFARMDLSDERLADFRRQLNETDQQRVEVVAYRKNGTPIWVELTNIALRGAGQVTGYVGIHRNITGRKRLEAEQQRLVDIVQNSSDFIGICDLDWQVLFINEAGQRMVGLNGIERVRRTRVPDYFAPEDRATVGEDMFAAVLEEGRWVGELNLRYFRTGESIPVLWDIFRLDDPDSGEPTNFGTIARDITERKRAEEELVGRARESAGLGSEAGYTLLSDEPVIMEDISTETRFRSSAMVRESGIVSGITAVIHGEEGPYGVLCAHSRSHRAFTEDDISFMQAVANVLGGAIERNEAQERLEELKEANPRAPQALVLSASLERRDIARAVEAGAAGVLSKRAHLDEVVEAVRRLRAGEPLMVLEEVVELLRFAGSRREEEIEARCSVEKLTSREVEVLQALAEGLGSEEIADRLHISLRTERNHMANILSKLGVHSQLQALVFALRHGVVEVR